MPDSRHPPRPPLPPWLRVRVPCSSKRESLDSLLGTLSLNTVCRSAVCPNLGECWGRGVATFMILGDRCTRACRFCAIGSSENLPPHPDPDEPSRLASAAKDMNLSYVVITSVTRDDLPDGGAAHFAATVAAVKSAMPSVEVEVLTPDFNGSETSIKTVLDSGPAVFNHNVETVERLSPLIRSRADYSRSLAVLSSALKLSDGAVQVKSGLMVGLGETDDEVLQTIRDIRSAGASILTVGQYLPPSNGHWRLDRYVEPATFSAWADFATSIGFNSVASAPLVRSSYNAAELKASSSIS